MNTLLLIQAILSLIPEGLTLTKSALALFEHAATAINATPGSDQHTAAVNAIANVVTPK